MIKAKGFLVTASILIAIFAIDTASANGNLVQNGGFELGANPYDSSTTTGSYGAGLQSWTYTPTVLGDGLEWVENTSKSSGLVGSWIAATQAASPNHGNFFLADAGYTYSGTISQTINGLTAGTDYTVSFFQAATSYIYSPSQYWSGTVASETAYWQVGFGTDTKASDTMTITHDSTTGTGGAAWVKESFTFKATSASEVLSFLSVGVGNPPMALLDGVTVSSAVPEASELTMLAFGLPMIAAAMRRRQTMPA